MRGKNVVNPYSVVDFFFSKNIMLVALNLSGLPQKKLLKITSFWKQ